MHSFIHSFIHLHVHVFINYTLYSHCIEWRLIECVGVRMPVFKVSSLWDLGQLT